MLKYWKRSKKFYTRAILWSQTPDAIPGAAVVRALVVTAAAGHNVGGTPAPGDPWAVKIIRMNEWMNEWWMNEWMNEWMNG